MEVLLSRSSGRGYRSPVKNIFCRAELTSYHRTSLTAVQALGLSGINTSHKSIHNKRSLRLVIRVQAPLDNSGHRDERRHTSARATPERHWDRDCCSSFIFDVRQRDCTSTSSTKIETAVRRSTSTDPATRTCVNEYELLQRLEILNR